LKKEIMLKPAVIRPARLDDADGILDVYRPYIQKTAVTFEYEVPAPEAFRARMEDLMAALPYLVYEEEGEVRGYAYAAKFRARAAYQWDVEPSIYLRESIHSRGTGTALFAALLALLETLGYYNAYACITAPNPKSVSLCAKFGFTTAGVMHKSGFKFGEWHDIIWMEKRLAPLPPDPGPPKNIREIAGRIPEIIAVSGALSPPRAECSHKRPARSVRPPAWM
jgi:phosphinothricin acetyltransferase